MPIITLRPRGIPELIDASFQLLRRHYLQFITLMAILQAPFLVMGIVFTGVYGEALLPGAEPTLEPFIALMAYVWVWFSVVDPALIVAASDAYLRDRIDIRGALRMMVSRLGRVLLANLVKFVLLLIGFVLFIVPGLFFFARYFAVPATLVLEQRSALAGLGRSAELSKGSKWRILLTVGLAFLVYALVVSAVVFASAALTGSDLLGEALSTIITILTYPLLAVVSTMLYYDVRIRKEAFDLEMMTNELDAPPEWQPA